MEASGERPTWATIAPYSPAIKTYWSQWIRLYIRDGVLVRRFYCLDDVQFFSYVLVIQDYLTKWVEAFPLANDKAETMAEVLALEWVCHYGAPQVLHSDQGRNFACF